MSRKKVIKFKGAFYHSFSRGNNKKNIFIYDKDYLKFLDFLKLTQEKHPFKLYAYALMPNHFHLLLETHEALISEVMHSLITKYAQYFNYKYKCVGHVFQSRYKSILVQKEHYFLKLLQYIHLNPYNAGIVDVLENYKWSSHNYYAGIKPIPLFNEKEGLTMINENREKAIHKYKKIIQIAMGVPDEFDVSEYEKFPIIGKSKFVNKILKNQEIRRRDYVKIRVSKERILEIICKELETDSADIRTRKNNEDVYLCRNLFIFIAREYSGFSIIDIANFLNMTKQGVSMSFYRSKEKLKINESFQSVLRMILFELEDL
ncbi:MAG: transposase [bacterium]|nr:transposase [bacterium]